ncbi:MAG: cache domain-containing protein [Ignavibacteriales bacterium]|nr:cache domain-containing protein [Ignavibacteriales bacterium]
MKISLRNTQLFGYTVVVILMGTFTIFAGLSFINDTVMKEAKLKVQMDLNSAWTAYKEDKALLQMNVSLVAQHELFRRALNDNSTNPKVSRLLDELREKYKLDFLNLVNRNGIIIGTSGKPEALKREVRNDPVIEEAFLGNVTSGTSLISRENLLLKSNELAEQAYIPVLQTERAKPTGRTVEDRGMILETAVPILNEQNEVYGLIYGGILLNRRFDLVDRIRSTVFGNDYFDGKPLGTVTLFLEDTRIATNVITADSVRAIGTLVSDEVYKKVLERGERFADRAFVVNDWYLSAYDPVLDAKGNIIGILYVGLLEKKYTAYGQELTIEFMGIGLIALFIAVLLANYLSRKVRRPILKLVDATREISNGKLDTRVTNIGKINEISELAKSFNSMAASLETDSKQLNEASANLKRAYIKADEKNRAYLEMLGFVTHELKSPLASIVFGIGSLRDKLLGSLTEGQEDVLKSSARSADYLNSTIANFLNLSRIEEGELKLKISNVSLNESIIEPAVYRLQEIAADNKMDFDINVPKDLQIDCDPDLMTSVFQNLISNALKYGYKGTNIKISSELSDGLVKISVFNEGSGFSNEDRLNMFTKFSRFNASNYSTKSGTGLGLFVTKNIILKHNGAIWAESELGKWAKFTFTIPLDNQPTSS